MSSRALAFAGLFLPPILIGCAHISHHPDCVADTTNMQTVDCTVLLEFRGKVRDAATGTPISYAEVVFIDTGMNPNAGIQPWTTRVGTSNASGVVDMQFGYGWYQQVRLSERVVAEDPPLQSGEEPAKTEVDEKIGSQETHTLRESIGTYFAALERALDTDIASKSFSLEIRKPGYQNVVHKIAMRDCPKEDDAYVVELGAVAMAR